MMVGWPLLAFPYGPIKLVASRVFGACNAATSASLLDAQTGSRRCGIGDALPANKLATPALSSATA